MLGYSTQFGQMQSIKLIATDNFIAKRIGYLGLTLLLSEDAELLILVTNSIKNDLENVNNTHYQALALAALGDISTVDMCRQLSTQVLELIKSRNFYIKKRAVICACNLIAKATDLVEL